MAAAGKRETDVGLPHHGGANGMNSTTPDVCTESAKSHKPDTHTRACTRETPTVDLADAFRPLPALRGLARLADLQPVLIVDTRERVPLQFTRLQSRRGTLHTGDYSFAGGEDLFAVERKTIADLVGCCVGNGRARFFRELQRLRGFRFARLVVIGAPADIQSHRYRANLTPAAVTATLAVIEARFVPVVFFPDPETTALQIERWAYWFAREVCQTANSLLRGTETADGGVPRSSPSLRSETAQDPKTRRFRAFSQPCPSAASNPAS